MIQWKCWTWYQEVTDDKEKVFHIYIKDEILKKNRIEKLNFSQFYEIAHQIY